MPPISPSWKILLSGSLLFLHLLACRPNENRDNQHGLLVVDQGAGAVSRYDLQNDTLTARVKVGYNPHEIEISGDRKTAYVTNFGIEDYDRTIGVPGVSISVIDMATMSEINRFYTNRMSDGTSDTSSLGPNRAPHGVKLRPPAENELFVNVEMGDSMLVFDPASGKITRSFPLPAGAHNFVFSPQGDTLWLFAGSNGIFRIDPDSGKATGHFQTHSAARGIIYSGKTGQLIVSCENEIYILALSDLSVKKHFQNLGVKQIIYSCLSPDGKSIFAPCPYDGQVIVVDIESGEVMRRLMTGKAPINVQIDPSGLEAIVANAMDDHLSVIDLQTFEIQSFGSSLRPNGMAFLRMLDE